MPDSDNNLLPATRNAAEAAGFSFSGSQPMLFDDWPEQPAFVEKVKEYLHTGKIVLQDQDRCLAVLRAVLLEVPVRMICREYRIGYESVQAIVVEAEKSGKLRTLKERMASGWAEIALLTEWRLKEALMAGKVPPNVLAILGGIATEKHQLLTGGVTASVELKRDEVSGDDVLADLEKMKRVKTSGSVPGPTIAGPTIEAESIVEQQKPKDSA